MYFLDFYRWQQSFSTAGSSSLQYGKYNCAYSLSHLKYTVFQTQFSAKQRQRAITILLDEHSVTNIAKKCLEFVNILGKKNKRAKACSSPFQYCSVYKVLKLKQFSQSSVGSSRIRVLNASSKTSGVRGYKFFQQILLVHLMVILM